MGFDGLDSVVIGFYLVLPSFLRLILVLVACFTGFLPGFVRLFQETRPAASRPGLGNNPSVVPKLGKKEHSEMIR